MKRALILLALMLPPLAAVADTDCRRLPIKPNPEQLDGPGSFGKLHGTVTLGCLRYVGSLTRDGVEWVLIRDERGEVHRLKVGYYMGPGVISAIDAEFIHLDLYPGVVRFPKNPR